MERRPDRAEASGRASPTAPDFVSPSYQAWNEALKDKPTRAALDLGLQEAAAGQTRPWSEIRRRPAQ